MSPASPLQPWEPTLRSSLALLACEEAFVHGEAIRAVVWSFMVEIYSRFTAEVGSAVVGEAQCGAGALFQVVCVVISKI